MPGFKQHDPDKENPAFNDFFNKEEYLESFMDGDKEFAKEFTETQLFSHFTESYLKEEVNNMMVYLNSNRSGFKEAYNEKFFGPDSNPLINTYETGLSHSSSQLDNRIITETTLKEWPKREQIKFNWRIPVDRQRVMLFEKLENSMIALERERILQEAAQEALISPDSLQRDSVLKYSRTETNKLLFAKL